MSAAQLFFDVFGRDKGVGKVFDDAGRKAESLGSQSSGAMGKVGSFIGGIGGTALKVVGVVGGAVAAVGGIVGGLAVHGGIARQLQIENAQAKLDGLGNSADSVKEIMANAMAAVKGTAFGMGEAATVAASAVAAGVKPGKDLERTLKLTGDAATIAGSSMGEMGSIFGKVAASNKLQGDSIAMLQDRGIPILQMLGKTLGKTSEEVADMASAGKIDFATFQKAMEEGLGGAALKSGDTTEGAFKNMKASFSRLGVVLTSWFMPLVKDVFNTITFAVDWLTKLLGPLSDAFGKAFQGRIGPMLQNAKAQFEELYKGAGGSLNAFRGAFLAVDGDIASSGFNGFMERLGFYAGMATSGVLAMSAAFQGFNVDGPGAIGAMARIGEAAGHLWAGLTMPSGTRAEMEGQLSGLVGVGAGVRAVFDAIGPAFAPLLPQISGLVGPLWTVLGAFNPLGLLFQALLPVLPQLVGLIGDLASSSLGLLAAVLPPVAGLVTELVSTLSGMFVAILPTVVSLVETLGSAFVVLAPVVGELVAAVVPLVSTLAGMLAPIIAELVSSVLPPVASIIGMIVEAITPLITTIAGILIPVIQALMPIVGTVFGAIASIITAVMQIVQGVIQVVTGIITGNWSQVWSGVLNIFSGVWNTIVAVVAGVLNVLGSVISNGLSAVGQFVLGILGALGRWFQDSWSSILGGVSGFIGSLLGFFGGLPGQILGFFGGLGSGLWDIGRNMIQGLIDGAGSLLRNLGSFFLNIVPDFIREPFKAALGIRSPSRVFRGFGVNIGQGLIEGLDSMQDRVGASVDGLVSLPAIAAGSGQGVGYGRGTGLEEKLDQLLELLRSQRPVQVNPAPGMSEANLGRMTAEQLMWRS
ncbi:phage tail protein [Sinomonas sp. P47F7]|uniref:phage tail protein n=1 Tax=Sinomonas sp. P47F7 TaxID=3410987 RepID=UPI003BF540BC